MSVIATLRMVNEEHIEQENFEEIPSFLLPHVTNSNYLSFNQLPTEVFEIPERDPKSNKIIDSVAFGPLVFIKSVGLNSTINNIVWSKYINELHFVCSEDLQEKIQTWPAALNTVYFATKVQLLNQINIVGAHIETEARWDDAKGWVKTMTVYNLPKKAMNGVNSNNLVKAICPHK
jgi:hypothetical protein